MNTTGEAIRAVCRVVRRNSCGSGSVCGYAHDGGAYVLTNAHVAGTTPNDTMSVYIESQGYRKYRARLVRAAYSSSSSADWALLHVEGLQDIRPVYLTRDLPASGESMYTKGFPACRPFAGSDITQKHVLNSGVLLWLPDSQNGQSGSGVWGDEDHLQKALLTWSIKWRGRWYGAGQLTNEIWRQNRDFRLTKTLRAPPRIPGAVYKELADEDIELDWEGIDRSRETDAVVQEGIFGERLEVGIQDYPIWSHMVDPEPAPDPETNGAWIRSLERLQDRLEEELAIARQNDGGGTVVDINDPETFGL